MAVTARCFVQAKYAETSATNQYIAPASARAILDKFTATNDAAAAQTLTVHIVPTGGTVGGQHIIVKTASLAAGESRTFSELSGQVLEGGDRISTTCSASNSIVIRVSGREVTG